MEFSVFVNVIIKDTNKVIVRATNCGDLGPPLVEFELPNSWITNCTIGKRYKVIIEEAEE